MATRLRRPCPAGGARGHGLRARRESPLAGPVGRDSARRLGAGERSRRCGFRESVHVQLVRQGPLSRMTLSLPAFAGSASSESIFGPRPPRGRPSARERAELVYATGSGSSGRAVRASCATPSPRRRNRRADGARRPRPPSRSRARRPCRRCGVKELLVGHQVFRRFERRARAVHLGGRPGSVWKKYPNGHPGAARRIARAPASVPMWSPASCARSRSRMPRS